MDDLSMLPEEVREALNDSWANVDYPRIMKKLRAELLRLVRENAKLALLAGNAGQAGKVALDRAERAESERDGLRETVKRLNRRVQVAEAALLEKMKASAPGSFGRGLANAAAEMYKAERDALQKRIDGAVIVCASRMVAPDGNGYTWVGAKIPSDWNGHRVALVVLP